jgi:beta-lactamase class A
MRGKGTVSISLNRRHIVGLGSAGLLAHAWNAPAAASQATPALGSAAWDDLTAAVEAAAPLATYLVSEIIGDTVQPIAGYNPEQEQGVGSSFKLYILATIGAQVRDGVLNWDDRVEIQEQFRSVPGGDLRYVKDGTPFTLRYIVERMIQKSDNTATDHAMGVAGREAIEEMFVTAGHAAPERNVPLLRTREFAFMKFLYPDVDRYLAADVATRREILETEIAPLDYDDLLAAADEQVAPVRIDTVEWFASATDLSNVMAFLKTMAESDFALQPILEVMALETQLPFDGEVWPYVGFKGGSEMGVLHGTWLMRRQDDRWFTFSIGFNDPEHEIDMEAAVSAMVDAVALLASHP